MSERWVIDVDAATLGVDEWYAFCPLGADDEVIVGMTFVSSEPPGRVVGCFSAQGDEPARTWATDHRDLLERWANLPDPEQDGGDPPDNPSPSR